MLLADDEVHVWQTNLDTSAEERQRLRQYLSLDEQVRANRFLFELPRQHFIVGRGLLRVIVGSYINVEPSQIQFQYGACGKPALANQPSKKELRFNVSHSHGTIVYAFAFARELGIDIEWINPKSEYEPIVRRFFSAQEYGDWLSLPISQREPAFFACWTRKESYIKAKGDGLTLPLDRFSVSLKPDEPTALLNVHDDPTEVSRWSLYNLAVGKSYAAALMVQGHGCTVKYCTTTSICTVSSKQTL